ncbi:MAG: hypothetical protein M5U19_15640 [Microthrixaceae bacterium]|nr:hypothetical protein [Microthrixaceae bacterium]
MGPAVMPIRRVSTPWSASADSRTLPRASMAAVSTSWWPLRVSSLAGGSFQGEL